MGSLGFGIMDEGEELEEATAKDLVKKRIKTALDSSSRHGIPSQLKVFSCNLYRDIGSNPRAHQEDTKALVAELKHCGSGRKDLNRGKHLHAKSIRLGCQDNVYISNTLITMYIKCSSIDNAQQVFESMTQRNVVSWTALILGYVENGQSLSALNLFDCMDCAPNSVTFLAAVKACTELASGTLDKGRCLEVAVRIHGHARKLGFDREVFLASSLVDMYSKCGDMKQARHVFETMAHRDVVSWTSLIVGYVENEQCWEALNIFKSMDCSPNVVALAAVLKACGGLEPKEARLHEGIQAHTRAKVLGLDRFHNVANTLIDMYSKAGDMQKARVVFDGMAHRDVVSWTALLAGYVDNGENSAALEMFGSMDCVPNRVTFAVVLKACSSLGAVQAGERIHDRARGLGVELDETVANGLVDFYAKCGNLAAAEKVFKRMKFPSVVSWNSLIGGHSLLGNTSHMFSLLERMQESGVRADRVTILLILTACSHAGMVEEGMRCFKDMPKYGITPTLKHYTCMVDMLGRANRLEEALLLVRGMDMAVGVNGRVWMALLVACVKRENVEISKVAFRELLALDENVEVVSGAYLLIRSLYEGLGLQVPNH